LELTFKYEKIKNIKIKVKIYNRIMAKPKGARLVITLECTDCRTAENKRSAGVSRYTTMKNRKNTPDRLELKKFCRYCNKHTTHKEIK
jgi:large subunit ribosomal protein L33